MKKNIVQARRKLFAVLLSVSMIMTSFTPVFAEENSGEKTVPAAEAEVSPAAEKKKRLRQTPHRKRKQQSLHPLSRKKQRQRMMEKIHRLRHRKEQRRLRKIHRIWKEQSRYRRVHRIRKERSRPRKAHRFQLPGKQGKRKRQIRKQQENFRTLKRRTPRHRKIRQTCFRLHRKRRRHRRILRARRLLPSAEVQV